MWQHYYVVCLAASLNTLSHFPRIQGLNLVEHYDDAKFYYQAWKNYYNLRKILQGNQYIFIFQVIRFRSKVKKHEQILYTDKLHFHQLCPLGRVGLVVAMSVCCRRILSPSNTIFLRPLIGPVIT